MERYAVLGGNPDHSCLGSGSYGGKISFMSHIYACVIVCDMEKRNSTLASRACESGGLSHLG